jgi:hypothetical protein
MAQTIDRTTTFVVEDCCNCFIPFAMTQAFQERRRKDKAWFYCPNGHAQQYTGKSDDQLLRDQKQQTASALEEARIQAAKVKQLEQEAARLRKRTQGGTCPCCNRSFVQLARHMKTKHPEHSAEQH